MGNDLVSMPSLVTTRAVTINAPTTSFFPWLALLGQGRGGFYSYDRLENNPVQRLDIYSAGRILPEFQDLKRSRSAPMGVPEVACESSSRASQRPPMQRSRRARDPRRPRRAPRRRLARHRLARAVRGLAALCATARRRPDRPYEVTASCRQ
jgi:hypothetical protein